jgi:hypothetical protein
MENKLKKQRDFTRNIEKLLWAEKVCGSLTENLPMKSMGGPDERYKFKYLDIDVIILKWMLKKLHVREWIYLA